MTVPSLAFLGYVAVVTGVVFFARGYRPRIAVLALANLGFIATFLSSPLAVVPFVLLVLCGYAAMLLARRTSSPAMLPLTIVASVLALFWLKGYPIFPRVLEAHAVFFAVGASYVFFRIVHLIVDARQRTLDPAPDLLEYAAYALDFTALVAGPIALWPDYRAGLSSRAFPAPDDAFAALRRIVLGFFKVGVLSAGLSSLHDRAIAAIVPHGALANAAAAMVVVGLYPLVLYTNFSGYTDVVVGCARFAGHTLPENFDQPFVARGFIEFWSRWHMSLSGWLRRYVYTPVLINLMRAELPARLEPSFAAVSYLVTFSLVGIWHGPTPSFLFFGLLQGAGVALNKAFQSAMIARVGRKPWVAFVERPAVAALSRGITYAWFAFTLLWFWSSWDALGALAGALGVATCVAALLGAVAAAVVTIEACRAAARIGKEIEATVAKRLDLRYLGVSYVATLALVTVTVAVVLDAPAPHIIYRAF